MGIELDIARPILSFLPGTSQRISSDQRTGAIIILGMLGVAKPDTILVPNKDTMLKVGLGKMGKVGASTEHLYAWLTTFSPI